MLSKPLPSAAENRLRCALSSVLCAAGEPQDAVDQAQLVLAQPDLPADLRDRALTARLQALAGLRHQLAGPAAHAVLAGNGQHGGSVTASALVTRAVVGWDNGQVSDALDLLRDAARRDGGISADARDTQPMLALAAALIDLRQLTEPTASCVPPTGRRCKASPPRRDWPSCAPASTWPPGGWPTPPTTATPRWASPRAQARGGVPRPHTACWP